MQQLTALAAAHVAGRRVNKSHTLPHAGQWPGQIAEHESGQIAHAVARFAYFAIG